MKVVACVLISRRPLQKLVVWSRSYLYIQYLKCSTIARTLSVLIWCVRVWVRLARLDKCAIGYLVSIAVRLSRRCGSYCVMQVLHSRGNGVASLVKLTSALLVVAVAGGHN